jgi:hypothetical protein
MSSNDQSAKLAAILKPLLDEIKNSQKEHTVAQTQEILVAIGRLDARLQVLEAALADKRKTVTVRGEKKAPEAAADALAPVAAMPTPKTFAVNKLVYFREQFKADPNFRAKYVTPELQQLMDKDTTILSKTKEEQKLIAQATFCWNHIKRDKKDLLAALENEYAMAKVAHEGNVKPQQTVEQRTPHQ